MAWQIGRMVVTYCVKFVQLGMLISVDKLVFILEAVYCNKYCALHNAYRADLAYSYMFAAEKDTSLTACIQYAQGTL